VPDFALTVGKNPVPLKASYRAVVDGTDGNTYLERVDAVLQETPIVAIGKVVHVEGIKGRLIDLDVAIEKGKLEDVLRLAVNAPSPPMTGALSLQAKLVLPPGDEEVVKKLRLDGAFAIEDGGFSDPNVQRQINGLSRRASGTQAEVAPPPLVASDFSGTFVLGDGILRLQKVTFDIPGALVELGGEYSLVSESLDFKGNLFMDARLSETVGGIGSVLLKAIDPLFRRDGRTVVPLRITGTRRSPSFGLDVRRVFGKG
jgi:hypothetical protein